mgnify:CR=1 FL=1
MLRQSIESLALLLFALPALAAGPLTLVSEDEARLPAGEVQKMRGITRGPTVELISPKPDAKNVKSPLDFKLRFVAHGGASIDAESVQLLYVKSPSVDLTERVAANTSADGISIGQAALPPGEHVMVVSVTDSSGRRGQSVFKLSVGK